MTATTHAHAATLAALLLAATLLAAAALAAALATHLTAALGSATHLAAHLRLLLVVLRWWLLVVLRWWLLLLAATTRLSIGPGWNFVVLGTEVHTHTTALARLAVLVITTEEITHPKLGLGNTRSSKDANASC